MAKINTFSDSAVTRIRDNVKWGEGVRRQGDSSVSPIYNPQAEKIHIQLTTKDEETYGYWKGEEVHLEEGAWEIKDGGRKWDGEEYPYIRHVNWEDATEKAIVLAFQVPDIVSTENPYVWVFDEEVTNPQGFIFVANSTGNTAQSTANDTWTMPRGGTIYTNHGKMDIPEGFEMDSDKTAYAKITFINFLGDWHIGAAEMTIEDGEYWEDKGSTLEVRVKIASTETKKDICRLTQHHAGDIRFELFKDVSVTSGNEWIGVVNNNSNYIVSHLLPYGKHQDEFLAFSGNCNDMPTDSFENFISWFNQSLVHLRYDELGHIYQREDCYNGDIDDYTDDEDDDNENKIAGNLNANATGSNITPWAVNDDGIDVTYKVLNGVKNYTNYVGVEDTMVFVTNDVGAIISTDLDVDFLGGPWSVNQVKKAELITGTSGAYYPILRLNEDNFKYNSTITVKAGVVNKGFATQTDLNTAACQAVITASPEIRDYEDPNATPYSIDVTYSLADLASIHKTEIDIKYSDGTPVLYRFNNEGAFSSGVTSFSMLGGAGSPAEIPDVIEFDLREGVAHGDVIKVTSRLVSIGGTDSNVWQSAQLYVGVEDDCVTDDSGEHATDATGECAEAEIVNSKAILTLVSGLNNWSASKTAVDVAEFEENPLGNQSIFGYDYQVGTSGRLAWYRIPANTNTIDATYRWYKYSGADSATHIFVASNTMPVTGNDVIDMTTFGASITPTNTDLSTDRYINLDGALGVVDSSQDFYIAWVAQHYYNEDAPATWPDADSNGGSVWISVTEINLT